MDAAIAEVPLLDLKAQYRSLKSDIDAAIQCVVDSQWFINGPEVSGLEEEIAEYCQAKECIGVSSGSDALLVSLMALEIGPGDEVITTPYTFFATVGAIVRLGATPVFCDVEPNTLNIDPTQVEARVTPRTKGIIPVHLFGQCAEMDPLMAIAQRHGLAVVEDAAQAIGAEYKNRRAGTIGTVGCFSFFPSKNLGAFGDGGAVVTNDTQLAGKLRMLRNHGAEPKYYYRLIGGNFRLDALHAAVLRVKLRYLDDWSAARQANAAYYDHAFQQAGVAGRDVITPEVHQSRHIFNQYVGRYTHRDAVREWLTNRRIGNEVYYPLCLHQQDCFLNLGYQEGDFPVAEAAAANTLAIPIYPELTRDQQRHVVDTIASYYANVANRNQRRCA